MLCKETKEVIMLKLRYKKEMAVAETDLRKIATEVQEKFPMKKSVII